EADDLQGVFGPERGLSVPDLRDLPDGEVEVERAAVDALAAPDEREPGIARVTRSDDELVVRALGDQPDAADILVLDHVAVSAIVGRTSGANDITEHQGTIELVPEAQGRGEDLPAPLQAGAELDDRHRERAHLGARRGSAAGPRRSGRRP